jgi:hypothetical protein
MTGIVFWCCGVPSAVIKQLVGYGRDFVLVRQSALGHYQSIGQSWPRLFSGAVEMPLVMTWIVFWSHKVPSAVIKRLVGHG